jgi:hypothetical protein
VSVRDDVPVDGALVAIDCQRRDPKLGADALQIEIGDCRVGLIGDVLTVHSERGGAPGGNPRPGDRRRLEAKIAVDARLGFFRTDRSGDVIRRVDIRARRRNADLPREMPQIDVSRDAVNVEAQRTLAFWQRDVPGDGGGGAIRRRASVERHAPPVHSRLRMNLFRHVPGRHHPS